MTERTEPVFRGMRWGMSKEEVRAAENSMVWGESEEALGFGSVELDWGGEDLRDSMTGTYVICFFDSGGLCKVQFPSRCVLGDDETAAVFFGRAREYLCGIYGTPVSVDEVKMVTEWRTGKTLITARIDAEYDGPSEMGLFGFHYHYPAEHYQNRVIDRYLRIVYSRRD